jgi:hypothetical protein
MTVLTIIKLKMDKLTEHSVKANINDVKKAWIQIYKDKEAFQKKTNMLDDNKYDLQEIDTRNRSRLHL